MAQKQAIQMISEMKEFATFTAAEQRYICRSLDVAARGIEAAKLWSRDPAEEASLKAQARLYEKLLPLVRSSIPDDIGLDASSEIIGQLFTLSAFDLGEGKIERFTAYRFLYERLLGASVRPWLPSAFQGAASLPYVHPEQRQTLLRSITMAEAAAVGWSNSESAFIPEWVDEVEITVSQA